jgi:hypothetical protein
MKLQVLETTVLLYPFINKGIKDRRYKTGYRVLPYAEVKTEMYFKLSNPVRTFRIYEIMELGNYGRYIVVVRDLTNDTMEVKVVRTSDFGYSNSFVVPKEVEAYSLGFTVVESSNYSKIIL